MSVWVFLGAALAGGVGAGLRYVVDVLVTGSRAGRITLGILVVNVTGSLALGVLTGVGVAVTGSDVAWVLGVGLLGGYTTFSTVALESSLLIADGETRRGWLNLAGTLVLCVGAATAGVALGRLLA
jgi:CrcB protein